MSKSTEDQSFEGIDFFTHPGYAKEYESCRFIRCNFSCTDLSHFRFVECTFQDCDLSNAKLSSTTLNDVRFVNCKMLGLHFENCSEFLFAVSFENSVLNFSSFFGRLLKKTVFKNCFLHEADFTDANLSGASFENCDLTRAVFDNTILEKADFRTAINFSIDPERNRLKKAKFNRLNLSGLLGKYDLDIS